MTRPFWRNLAEGFHHRRIRWGKGGFDCFIWRGKQPGPVLLMNGGTHGDEYEGPVLLAELTSSWRPKVLSGTVVAVPVLDEASFFAGRQGHVSPLDGKNLARVFPGKPDGSPTEQLAHVFLNRLLKHADFYVDFHSAGAMNELLPWVGYFTIEDEKIMEKQRLMAQCYDRWWCWGAPYNPGRTLSAAYKLGIPAIYLEGQGKGDVAPEDLTALHRGTKRLLATLGFTRGKVDLRPQRITREADDASEHDFDCQQHPAPCNGLLMWVVRVGKRVQQDEKVAIIQPLDGSKSHVIHAAKRGRVVLARRHRSICKGEPAAWVVAIP